MDVNIFKIKSSCSQFYIFYVDSNIGIKKFVPHTKGKKA